jgi:RNA polymerase sigma-70 factor (ECF subfamily)
VTLFPGAGEGEGADAEAVAAVLRGDVERFAVLVGRHQERLYRHALGMVLSPDAAADLVQDALVKAYTSLSRCSDPARFGAWVFRILQNRCRDHLKNRRQHTVVLHAEMAFAADGDGPESACERAELGGAVERALATLPEAQREAFLLKHVEGLSYEEMAGMLEASVSALKMRVLRAREVLQAALQGVRG